MKKQLLILLLIHTIPSSSYLMDNSSAHFTFHQMLQCKDNIDLVTFVKKLPDERIIFFDCKMRGYIVDPANTEEQLTLINTQNLKIWSLTDAFISPKNSLFTS